MNSGFVSGGIFRKSYTYESRWIDVFKSLKSEVDWLKLHGVPAFVYFLAEWRKLTPYYAKLSGFDVSYTVVPTRYIIKPFRLTPEVDPGEHATPEGNRLIGSYLYNALLQQQIIRGLQPISIEEQPAFPGQSFVDSEIEQEFKANPQADTRYDLIPLNDGFMGREGRFSALATSGARNVTVRIALIDDPGLYPLILNVRLESPEQVSVTKVFEKFVTVTEPIEIPRLASLDRYPTVEISIAANHIVTATNGVNAISMKRPKITVH